jgi:archaellum biogenesis protein FlaJ (TadC family)
MLEDKTAHKEFQKKIEFQEMLLDLSQAMLIRELVTHQIIKILKEILEKLSLFKTTEIMQLKQIIKSSYSST